MEKSLIVLNKSVTKEILKYLLKSILAGIMIAIGGTIYLSLENKIVGAFMFAIGLFVIVSKGLNLYTGKVGYVVENKPSYLIEVITTLIGNFIGTYLVGYILRFTRIYVNINEKARSICGIKLEDSIVSIVILSILCGILMYLAVDGYKKITDSMGKNLIVFLAVAVFILCGFEHSIANMYYFSVADMWTLKTFGYVGLMVLGNAVGGVLFPVIKKAINKMI